MRIEQINDVQILRPILLYRQAHTTAARFGIETSLEDGLADLARTQELALGAMFVGYDGAEPVGCLVIIAAPNFYGPQQIAIVKYWYALPNHVRAGPALMREAFRWAQENGCSHLLCSATEFFDAPESDKVARFYELLGMKLLERVYICEV